MIPPQIRYNEEVSVPPKSQRNPIFWKNRISQWSGYFRCRALVQRAWGIKELN